VFSLPNLFVLAPLLALDLVGVVRGRQRVALRVAGEAVAGAIALVHYVIFVRPQGAVASQGFWSGNFAPHALGAFCGSPPVASGRTSRPWSPAWPGRTLRQFGYCPVSDTGFVITGHLTVLRACPSP
jgi:hypothetical protein